MHRHDWALVDATEAPPRSIWSALRSSLFGLLTLGDRQYLPDADQVLRCRVCGKVRRIDRQG